MPCDRWALRFLAYAESFGAREEIVGDVLEEFGRGRSSLWVCFQSMGLFGVALRTYLHGRARLTPQAVAFGFGMLLLGGVSIGSVGPVLEAWLGFYYVAGALSLFGEMASRTVGARPGIIVPAADAPHNG